MRLCFSSMPVEKIEEGIARLGRLLGARTGTT
jgi:DNA-binding transcriptional MocR family regulator